MLYRHFPTFLGFIHPAPPPDFLLDYFRQSSAHRAVIQAKT